MLRDALPGLLEPAVKEFVFAHFRKGLAKKEMIRKHGGVPRVSRDIAAEFSTLHWATAFSSNRGNPPFTRRDPDFGG